MIHPVRCEPTLDPQTREDPVYQSVLLLHFTRFHHGSEILIVTLDTEADQHLERLEGHSKTYYANHVPLPGQRKNWDYFPNLSCLRQHYGNDSMTVCCCQVQQSFDQMSEALETTKRYLHNACASVLCEVSQVATLLPLWYSLHERNTHDVSSLT